MLCGLFVNTLPTLQLRLLVKDNMNCGNCGKKFGKIISLISFHLEGRCVSVALNPTYANMPDQPLQSWAESWDQP